MKAGKAVASKEQHAGRILTRYGAAVPIGSTGTGTGGSIICHMTHTVRWKMTGYLRLEMSRL
ncbi:hypothetical protein C8A03DRAFT_37070 [Achaetomium macrosporum]|uniref:Uncharacterized protein n=1 Tax=Achaetomium macrosporum TaxID=79813 RepID=A0AAN7C4K1_9PEZI|nr:hypothetical protein C8A03DRAFT_37070 [Achaetomium macrosporum]